VTDAGRTRQVIKAGTGPAAARTPAFKSVNAALGNTKGTSFSRRVAERACVAARP
jgi:hypothetical protein